MVFILSSNSLTRLELSNSKVYEVRSDGYDSLIRFYWQRVMTSKCLQKGKTNVILGSMLILLRDRHSAYSNKIMPIVLIAKNTLFFLVKNAKLVI